MKKIPDLLKSPVGFVLVFLLLIFYPALCFYLQKSFKRGQDVYGKKFIFPGVIGACGIIGFVSIFFVHHPLVVPFVGLASLIPYGIGMFKVVILILNKLNISERE